MTLLRKENVQILESAKDWKDAIIKSVLPLENGGFVTEEYKHAVISNVEEYGPYICIAPHVAMPHARPEQGAISTQIALTLFKKEVSFEKEDAAANLFIALAAADSNSHLDTLMQISEILQDEEKAEKMLKSGDAETLYSFFA